MKTIKSYHDLEVYVEALDLAVELDQRLERFPARERKRVIDQLGRCSSGIGAHIAEGWGRKDSVADFKRFLRMALGNIQETKYWIEFSTKVGHFEQGEGRSWWKRYDELAARMFRLIQNWEDLSQ